MSKVFLSYSHKDEGFVEKLYRKLVKDGVECWFDREAIPWGSNFVVELEKGIDNCEIIVLILSPDYCLSEWAMIENTSARIDDPAGFKRRIRPLLLKSCKEILPRFLKLIQQIDISTPEKFEQESCQSFRIVIASGGIKTVRLPARSPNLNAFSERWVRSIKDECLSKLILFGESSLRRACANIYRTITR